LCRALVATLFLLLASLVLLGFASFFVFSAMDDFMHAFLVSFGPVGMRADKGTAVFLSFYHRVDRLTVACISFAACFTICLDDGDGRPLFSARQCFLCLVWVLLSSSRVPCRIGRYPFVFVSVDECLMSDFNGCCAEMGRVVFSSTLFVFFFFF
jgi:hypothetical protein